MDATTTSSFLLLIQSKTVGILDEHMNSSNLIKSFSSNRRSAKQSGIKLKMDGDRLTMVSTFSAFSTNENRSKLPLNFSLVNFKKSLITALLVVDSDGRIQQLILNYRYLVSKKSDFATSICRKGDSSKIALRVCVASLDASKYFLFNC